MKVRCRRSATIQGVPRDVGDEFDYDIKSVFLGSLHGLEDGTSAIELLEPIPEGVEIPSLDVKKSQGELVGSIPIGRSKK